MRHNCWKTGICEEHGHKLANMDACADCSPRAGAKPPAKISADGPHDAYQTAKPGEPVWTAQGGDPLAPPTLLFYAMLARTHAGVLGEDARNRWLVDMIRRMLSLGTVPDGSIAQADLLTKATGTEQVAWSMQEYQRGDVPAEITVISSGEVRKQQSDVWDTRRRIESACSNAEAELTEALEQYKARLVEQPIGLKEGLEREVHNAIAYLRDLRTLVHVPRPGERLSD